MTDTPDPIEAAIEAGQETIGETVDYYGTVERAIRAAAPLLIAHGRELAAKAIEALQGNVKSEHPAVVTVPKAARLARGDDDE